VGHGWTLWVLTGRHKEIQRGQWDTVGHYGYCQEDIKGYRVDIGARLDIMGTDRKT